MTGKEQGKAWNNNTLDLPEGYRMTELGPLPEEWRVVRLGEIAELGSGKGTQTAKGSLIPFVPMSLLPEDSIYISSWEMRQPVQIRSGIVVREGNFLLAKITPCLENGKQGIVRGIPNGWGYATTEVIPIRPRFCLHIEYLAYYMKQPTIRQELASKMEGTTGRQRLPKAVVQQLVIPLPPLAEQRAIAHVLRTVQEAKETTERVIAAARELKRSLMRHLFTYGPVPVDQADQVPLQETEIGPIPAHWRVVRLGEVVSLTKGRKPPKLLNAYVAGALPYLTADYFRTGAASGWVPVECLSRMPLCSREDVVLIWDGSKAGQVFTGLDGVLASTMVRVTPTEDLRQDYLFFLLSIQFELLNTQTTGSTIPHVNKELFHNLFIPLPPLPEQQEIARILRAVDEKIQAEERRKEALEGLFKALLHHLMTARVRLPKEFIARFEEVTNHE